MRTITKVMDIWRRADVMVRKGRDFDLNRARLPAVQEKRKRSFSDEWTGAHRLRLRKHEERKRILA
ncbi:hypothetical protein [Bacillus sp. EB600]|uniref:hypothetical protein n=1 Tax=Bacillus sp. EB600 TaxID=2806345 RepID=UPI00210D4FDF|nr:hypothetical protein [Bacillus sp. EB600]MCQ6278542.1 hypothetical protein [Bacillus sp. EB600]